MKITQIVVNESIELGDNFDIELGNTVIESRVVGFMNDGVVVEADDKALALLGISGALLESVDVNEVSMGDYYKKAKLSQALGQIEKSFGRSPEAQAKGAETARRREAGLARLDARSEKARAANQQKELAELIARLPELKQQYADMRAEYDSLGGSNWQYADREQNLTDKERRARSMEYSLQGLLRQIQAAEKAQKQQGVAEGSLNEVTQGVEHSEWADNVKDAYYPAVVKIIKKRTEDGRHIKSQAMANGKLVGQYNMNTGVGTFTNPKKQGVAEAQSMGGALANALSRVEPGSKLDKKIKHHNDMVRRFGKGTMTSAPDGYHIDKKGLVRLGQGVAESSINEWVDPGPPCAVCGRPHDEHRVKFDRKNPKLSFMDPNEEWNDLEMSNAEDHEFSPMDGYKPLSQREAELVGFNNLNVDMPDDIYDRINRARQRMARVGAGAGKLTRVKEQGVAEGFSDLMAKERRKRLADAEKKKQERLAKEKANKDQKTKGQQGVAEGSGNIGNAIKSLYQKIYNAGDDEIEYFYHDSPIFAQYWDEYEGDLDSIIADVDPSELQIMLDELESYVDQANLTEGQFKQQMHVDAERMELSAFIDKYGNEDWIKEFWQAVNSVEEAKYQGRTVPLGKPMQGDVKKFKVYVKNKKGNVIKVNFGDPNMRIKKSNPARRKSFRARHRCATAKDRTSARYWSCRKW